MCPELKERTTPSASRKSLMIAAGLFWLAGAIDLFFRATALMPSGQDDLALIVGVAILVGSLKFRFVLTRMLQKNIDRVRNLYPEKPKICVFAFQSVQSYMWLVGMVAVGLSLRLLPIWPPLMSGICLAIGSALILGAVQYFRSARQF